MPKKKLSPAEALEAKAHEIEQIREGAQMSYAGDEREETGELTVVDQHPADSADFAFQRELSDTQQRILQQEEEQVREAIDRARAGQYGICADCGRPIGKARLAARPEATHCIECQTRHEQERR